LKIQQLEIKNYKSLKHVSLDGVQDLNVIVGRNNSGKSNLVDALKFFFNRDGQGWSEDYNVSGVPKHLWFNYDPSEPIELSVTFRPSPHWVDSVVGEIPKSPRLHEILSSPIQVNKMVFFKRNLTHFVIKSIEWGGSLLVKPPDLDAYPERQQSRYIMKSSSLETPGYVPTPDLQSLTKKVLNAIDNRFMLIPAKRRIADRETRMTGVVPPPLDGTNLKNTLQRLKNSEDARQRAIFRSIKAKVDKLGFIAGAMESIESGDVADLTFDRGELTFPLSSQGTGIHEILTFVVNLAIRDGYFFGIEEPENHLHYDAQRALLDIMEEESNRNQIFVTSHSSLFVDQLNYDSGRVYLTRLTEGAQTQIQSIGGPEQFELIVDEIGRISSLLLPDAVVFVEGKSDQSIFAAIAGTLKALSRARLEFVNMTGRTKLPYFAAISLILKAGRDLPFFYIVDGTSGKRPEEDKNEICSAAKANVSLDNDQIENLKRSIFVLSKPQIEAYLLKPSTVSHVFQIPLADVQSWFNQHSARRNKFYVLDGLLRRYGKGKYDKALDGGRIARALTQEEIDVELIKVIEEVVQLSRRLQRD